MEVLPLVFLALAVVGGAIVLRSMIRLKRAAVQTLEAARQLDEGLQSLREQIRVQEPSSSPGDDATGS